MKERVTAIEDDRRKNAVCNAKVSATTGWWNDLQKLFTLVRFGEERIPPDLAVRVHLASVRRGATKPRVSLDQDALKEKMRKALKKHRLVKGKTVPAEEMYSIAKEINITGIELIESAATFSRGQPAYQLAYKYASELGYSQKKKRRFPELLVLKV